MNKLSFLSILIISFFSFLGYSQVGIGNVDPKASLDISADPNGIPAFRIEPQESPVGTHNGQMAVVDNMLYLYDEVRQKWLSVESHALQFGRSGNAGNNDFLRFGGDVIDVDSGAPMPRKGTIVAISAISSSSNSSNSFQLWIDGSKVPSNSNQNLSGQFSLSSSRFFLKSYNLDFDTENEIMISRTGSGGNVANPVVILWIKWRL